jgi:hypothetical protein
MHSYAWSCLACDTPNAAGEVRCLACECPAFATNADVLAAGAAYRRRAGLPPLGPADPLRVVMELPLLPIGAVVLLLLGAMSLIVGESGSTIAFGGLLLALSALCISSWRPRRRGATD